MSNCIADDAQLYDIWFIYTGCIIANPYTVHPTSLPEGKARSERGNLNLSLESTAKYVGDLLVYSCQVVYKSMLKTVTKYFKKNKNSKFRY